MFKRTKTNADGSVHKVDLCGPGWPDMHGWAFVAFFIMTMYILRMIEKNPNLLAVPSFMQFAGQLATGGILAAAAWLWTSNKNKEKVEADQAANGKVEDVTVKAEGDVTVEKVDDR